jgi:fatty-acyl-CoA synthase
VSESLISRLEAAADRDKAITFVETDDPERVPWGRIHEDACSVAGGLQALGIGPGETVAVLGPTSRRVITAIRAIWLTGAAVTVLPLRSRLMSEAEFGEQNHARLSAGAISLVLADPDLVHVAESAPGRPKVVTFSDIQPGAGRSKPSDYQRPPDDPEATAILQFTSGSTSDPKGVVIPHRCVLDNHDAVAERAPIEADDDVVVSWCPLYHDMGLVMLMSYSMTVGADFVIAPPTRFIASPGLWMEWISAFRGTWTIGPNAAFATAARMLSRSKSLDLSSCRGIGNGSEPIDGKAVDLFAAAAAPHSLDPSSIYAGYGMAEATVVISLSDRGAGLGSDFVNADVLEYDLRAEPVPPDHPRVRRIARCGRPLRGMETRVVDPETGRVLGERCVGELEVRGPSVVPGYFRRPDATRSAFREGGWLRTGDLVYFAEGELVICGRLKDVIIHGGRNVFPTDVERAVDDVDGIRKGNVIAFGIESDRSREAVVVVAEAKGEDLARIRADIARATADSVGIRPADIVLVPQGSLPKTSSGKLRRSLCRARYLTADLEAL